MGAPQPPQHVKLFCGLIAADSAALDAAQARLAAAFGPPDLLSPVVPFDFTDYYNAEMGPALLRRFVAFADLIEPDRLAGVKRLTNEMEAALADRSTGAPRRRVNLDPGYVTPAKVVLATVKDFAHRVYLSDGIYAEVTLNFGREGCRFLPWTYPDYRSPACVEFLLAARRALRDAAPPSDRHRACPGC